MERNSEEEEEAEVHEDQHLLMQPSLHDRQTKTRLSGFEISSNERSAQRFPTLRSFGGNLNKCYLLAISIPVFVVLILVSINSGKLFHGGDLPSLNLRTDSLMNRMRESELRALSLLKRQRMEFLRMWNLTLRDSVVTTDSFETNSNNSSKTANNESAAHSVSAEDLRSELIKQIKMNEDIQSALLASHLSGKENGLSDSNVFDSDIFGSDKINRCSKLQPPTTNRKMEWEPDPNKFLFAICNSGQMSNHMICLEKHMFFAALLGRTLIFPSPKVDYQYDRVLNISHVNTCFGKRVVVTFDEFEQMRKGQRLRIDRFICYMSSCFLDEDHLKKLRGLGLTLPKLENAWQTDVDVNRKADEVRNKFSCGDEVLAVGDLFYARVEEEWLLQVGGPLVHTCKSVLQPHRLIYLTAQRFIQTFLGENFVALHFRRHGFLKFCNVKKESCFYPIPQAAECLARVLEKSNAPVIYLSTDAAESETDLLQALMVVNGKTIPLVKRPAHTSVEKWDALLYRNHLGSDDQVDAMLDKTICGMSSVFIGASGSTFTEDIMRLRRAWGSVSVCDEYLCEGEKPNFIAEIG